MIRNHQNPVKCVFVGRDAKRAGPVKRGEGGGWVVSRHGKSTLTPGTAQ